MLYQLIYSSSATQLMTDDDISKLSKCAATRNFGVNITGVLLYLDGTFLQVLEGPKARVLALYNRIETDQRHKNPCVLLKRDVPEREFGSWSMGCKTVSKEDCAQTELFDLATHSPTEHAQLCDKGDIAILLRSFLSIQHPNYVTV